MKNTPRPTLLITAFLAAAFAFAGPAAHAEVYKWVDANGKTQFSDKPPPNQKNVKQLDLKNTTVSPADKAAADARVAAEKARAQGSGAATSSRKSDTKAAGNTDDGKSELQKSEECFAKYRLPNGRLSPEAGANCKEVKIPN